MRVWHDMTGLHSMRWTAEMSVAPIPHEPNGWILVMRAVGDSV